MNTANGQEILKAIIGGVEALAKNTFGSAADSAKKDAQAFLDSIKEDLSAWTQQLAQGKISADDLRFQIESKKDLAQMTLLKNTGIAEIKIDEFKNGVVNIISSTILSKIGLG
jgi:hypothetical protein